MHCRKRSKPGAWQIAALDEATREDLGQATRIEVGKEKTTVVDGRGKAEPIKARVEAALHATRAALKEGVVPGGVALLRAQHHRRAQGRQARAGHGHRDRAARRRGAAAPDRHRRHRGRTAGHHEGFGGGGL